MTAKVPAVLLVLIETARLRWFVAAVGLDGAVTPLLRSEIGDLAKYRSLDFDAALSFLRHRLCGVLQRGCDRLWGRGMKACQFAVVFEGPLPEPTGALTPAIADHLATWMLNPPAASFVDAGGPQLEPLAGNLDPARAALLPAALTALRAVRDDDAVWEPVAAKPADEAS